MPGQEAGINFKPRISKDGQKGMGCRLVVMGLVATSTAEIEALIDIAVLWAERCEAGARQ